MDKKKFLDTEFGKSFEKYFKRCEFCGNEKSTWTCFNENVLPILKKNLESKLAEIGIKL